MDKIFCLETEWDQSVHDLKMKSAVLPLLEFTENKYNLNIPHIFRQVATASDFDYYIKHLREQSYKSYDFIYLCFHGLNSEITFANKESITLENLASQYGDVFEKRKIHFGSCYTLSAPEEEILQFKRATKARLITGYTKSVPFMESFIFELWLIRKMHRHDSYGAKKLLALAEKEMPFYTKKLGFIAY